MKALLAICHGIRYYIEKEQGGRIMEMMTLLKIIFTGLLCIPVIVLVFSLMSKLIDQYSKKK